MNDYELFEPFVQREESWIDFNYRVLQCSEREGIPLNEKLNFLAITASNLDEFIGVRYSTLISEDDEDIRKRVLEEIHAFLNVQWKRYKTLVRELSASGIYVSEVKELPKDTRKTIEKLFENSIFPLLTPIRIGSTNDFPNLISGMTYIVVTVEEDSEEVINLVPIANMPLMYNFNGTVVYTEDIVMTYIDKLFVKKKIESQGYFRVIKDANIILDHDRSKFILDRMNDTLSRRKFSNPIFMEISDSIPKRIRSALTNAFSLKKEAVHVGKVLDYTRFSQKLLDDSESYAKYSPAQYEVIGEQYSLFSELDERDILLQHPYDSYDTVLKFIEHAANDKDVLAIKMTLYRVSSVNSPIINSLIQAVANGKEVSVLVEIKARFNESMNIGIVNKLKFAGVNVILGEEELKTHCKFCIVVRREADGVRLYSHIATGNYNEKTARIYTDLSYFTAKQKIGSDLINIFNILSGLSDPDGKLSKVFYAPINLRSKLIKLIDREIQVAKKGKKSEITIKVNSISDEIMVNKLYDAADAGVNVTIICRGVCSVVARKNLRVKSIVGRFLEHSRIYKFHHKGKTEWYISSADLLTRNLDKRIEIMVSIENKKNTEKLNTIINALIRDEYNSYIMDEHGNFIWTGGSFDSHQWFINSAMSEKPLKLPKHKK